MVFEGFEVVKQLLSTCFKKLAKLSDGSTDLGLILFNITLAKA